MQKVSPKLVRFFNCAYNASLRNKRDHFWSNRNEFIQDLMGLGYNSITIKKLLQQAIDSKLITEKPGAWVKLWFKFHGNLIKKSITITHYKDWDKDNFLDVIVTKISKMNWTIRKGLKLKSPSAGRFKVLRSSMVKISVERLSEISGYSIGKTHLLKHRLMTEGAIKVVHRQSNRAWRKPCDWIGIPKLQPLIQVN